MPLLIRSEAPPDHPVIHALTARAFAQMPYAAGDEQHLIDRLRTLGALSLSLVAVQTGVVIGHVALSPATHESGATGWFALGPISVAPALQKQGVGAALLAAAKAWLDARQASGCILVGNPRYYCRHGFAPAPDHAPAPEPAEYFMAQVLRPPIPAGRFGFHPAFYE
jgi:putative acetyltransferase